MTLNFEGPSRPKRLPENYLPAAFLQIQKADDLNFPIIPVPQTIAGTQRPMGVVSGEDLADPVKIGKKLDKLDDGSFSIGPGMQSSLVAEIPSNSVSRGSGFASVPVLGVIDAGIAFWNRRFFAAGNTPSNIFKDVGFINFDVANNGQPIVNFLQKDLNNDLDTFRDRFDSQDFLIDWLGQNFPGSVYAEHRKVGRLFKRDGFNHGTAMADFALSTERPAPFLAAFGIELPTDAVIDSSGGTVQIVLQLAIRALLRRVVLWSEQEQVTPDIKIVLPIAFTGAPVSTENSILTDLTAVLQEFGLSSDQVEIFVPAGNHRQQQIHATVNADSEKPLRWFVEPDDYAPNTIEFESPATSKLSLQLKDPHGGTVQTPVVAGEFWLLKEGEDVIGAMWTWETSDQRRLTRLTLAASEGGAAGRPVALAGDWEICFVRKKKEKVPIKLWIMREDLLTGSRRIPPYRQSRFRDADYQKRAEDGSYVLGDDQPNAQIKRLGTVSVLATLNGDIFTPVSALYKRSRKTAPSEAFYSGAYSGDVPAKHESQLVDILRPGSGKWAIGNGGARIFRVSGTSVATAKKAADP